MTRIILMCLPMLAMAGCMTGSSAEMQKLRMAEANARAKANERARAEAERDKATANRDAERVKAEAEKKKLDAYAAVEMKKSEEHAAAERYKADAALKQACEDRRKAEAVRDAEIHARYNKLLNEYGSGEMDFRGELAMGERSFNELSKDRYRLESAEGRMVGEYVHCLRLLCDKCKLTEKQIEAIFLGAVILGRANVLAWSHHTMGNKAKLTATDLISPFERGGRSVLQLALSGQDTQTLDYIWQLHPRLDHQDCDGDVALHYAIRRGTKRDIAMSLDTNLVNRVGKDGKTPLFVAIDFYRHDVTQLLLKQGACAKSEIRIAVDDPANGKSVEVPVQPFGYACYKGDIEAARMLAAVTGVTPTMKDLRLAIVRDRLDLVKWFVEGLHFNVNDSTLANAAHAGTTTATYLRERGAVNQNATR